MAVDEIGALVDAPHTLVFAGGLVGGAVWDLSEPPPVLGGSFVDVPLKHNALVYDAARNARFAQARPLGNAMRNIIHRIIAGHILFLEEVGRVTLSLGENRDQHIGAGDLVAAR